MLNEKTTDLPLTYQLNEHPLLQRFQLQSTPNHTLPRRTNHTLKKLLSLIPPLQHTPNHSTRIMIHEVIVVRQVGAEGERERCYRCVEDGEREEVVLASDDRR